MRNVKLTRSLTRSLHLAVIGLFLLSFAPQAWSDETTPAADTAAPPATSGMSNEGVPPAPAADPGMGAPNSEPTPAEKPVKRKKKSKHASKKKSKHSKKKAGKKKKKKKHYNNY